MNGLTNMFSDFEKAESNEKVIGMMTEAAIMRDIRDTHLATVGAIQEDVEAPDISALEGALFMDTIDPVLEAKLDEDWDMLKGKSVDECGDGSCGDPNCDGIEEVDDDEIDETLADGVPEGDEDETAAVLDECSESTADAIIAQAESWLR